MLNTLYFSQNQKQFDPADLFKVIDSTQVIQFEVFKKFLDYSYMRTQGNDFWLEPIENIKQNILALWLFIQVKAPNDLQIKVFNPNLKQDGFESNYTLALINQVDAPFIVDSLQIALNNLQRESLPILSIGGLCVVRDSAGVLTDILDYGNDVLPAESVFEDPVLLQISKQFDEDYLINIKNQLLEVLNEAHIAYDDQKLMREKIQAVIDEFDQYRPSIRLEELRETITFLNWLLKEHFYFLGYRGYLFNPKDKNPSIDLISGSGLGLLRDESRAVKNRLLTTLPTEAQRLATTNHILVITKTNTKSQVHKSIYTDYISIKQLNKKGEIVGEYRFIGLFLHSAYNDGIMQIPYLRKKANALLIMAKTSPDAYLGKSIIDILENFPRDEFFQINAEELYKIVSAILSIRERRITRLLICKDPYGRFYSCFLYLPKEKITAALAEKIEHILVAKLHGHEVTMAMQLDTSALGRIHYVVRLAPDHRDQSGINFELLENEIIEASKTWNEKLKDLLSETHSALLTAKLYQQYKKAFSVAYQEDFSPSQALEDIEYIEELHQKKSIAINLSMGQDFLSFKLFQLDQPTTLSEIIPILENMGLEAIEENAYKCNFNEKITWICDYKLRIRDSQSIHFEKIKLLFKELFFSVWQKKIENDRLNALVLKCELSANLVAVLRAYCAYLKLIGIYSYSYLIQVLNNNFHISKQLLQLFTYRFDPEGFHDAEIVTLKNEIKKNLNAVSHLEEDKILRTLLALIEATLRTNYYQTDAVGERKSYLSFKLQSSQIPNLPLPKPLYEIFVYSSRFEAIHLRAAKVARGGIRWSNRHEDFRTEVLSLMKAQQVKNTVIVPGGSKGGFVLKMANSKLSQNQLQEEAIFCYKNFMRGLLDLTDNLVNGKVVSPQQLKTYDCDDPYLVVAADKGTASFSDEANEVAAEYNFWLGDAFASGGSHGYDHKKMAITATGAWISVENHLKALSINPALDSFTVVGIGDMSGDVFGNGMLLSNQLKLVAAFNHLHIFIDPTPDPVQSFAERLRLFGLPQSNWSDYNRKAISAGGNVFDRAAKSIELSLEVKQLLNLMDDVIEPNDLIRAILRAKVDLLFNGGIGTYVKASTEQNNQVGDKTNDVLRINADELRCKAVGEGGNLGFTQLARVEYAQSGGLIFTDFVDNSAGVDLSDHEVNIKILMSQASERQLIHFEQRNVLLAQMTEEVKNLVLNDNRNQTEALSFATSQAVSELEIYMRCINQFEQRGILNRAVEFLPSERALEERAKMHKGLTAPEIAIVNAYVKMDVKHALLQSNIPDSDYFQKMIEMEFPHILNERYYELMEKHQLRREIIATQLTNQLITQASILFVQRLREETNASIAQIVRAYAIIINVFELPKLHEMIRSLDFKVDQSIQTHMRKLLVRFLRRATRWLIRHHLPEEELVITLKNLSPIRSMLSQVDKFLSKVGLEKYEQLIELCVAAGVPAEIAKRVAQTYYGYLLLEVNQLAQETQVSAIDIAKLYFKLGTQLGLDWLRDDITNQAVANQWESLAHSSLRDQLDNLQSTAVRAALPYQENLEQWFEGTFEKYEAWKNMIDHLRHASKTNYVMYSVVLNTLSQFVGQLGKAL